jgi:hypothetical protein
MAFLLLLAFFLLLVGGGSGDFRKERPAPKELDDVMRDLLALWDLPAVFLPLADETEGKFRVGNGVLQGGGGPVNVPKGHGSRKRAAEDDGN